MSEVRLSTVIMMCAVVGAVTYVINSRGGAAENIWRKVKLSSIGAVHMLFSKDKKFKPEVGGLGKWADARVDWRASHPG